MAGSGNGSPFGPDRLRRRESADAGRHSPRSAAVPPTAPVRQEKTHDPLNGTYWTAVWCELDDEYKDYSDLPTEERWADLWLYEDGSAQYREVNHCVYNAEIHGGQWQAGEENTLRLMTSDPNAVYSAIDGYLDGKQLVLEYNSQRFYLEQAEPPVSGGELLYETTLGLNEPLWLGLNIPEGTPEMCLFFKLPYEEVWSIRPFTNQEPYRVEGHTYFVLN